MTDTYSPKTYRVYAFGAAGYHARTKSIEGIDQAESACESIATERNLDCYVITDSMAIFMADKALMAKEGLCAAEFRSIVECHSVFAFEAA